MTSRDDIHIYAHGNDPGLKFIFSKPTRDAGGTSAGEVGGGIYREEGEGHFVTFVGRGGTGKSLLTLQIVVNLLKQANPVAANARSTYPESEMPDNDSDNPRHHAVFYFTLEASAGELATQIKQFSWGKEFLGLADDPAKAHANLAAGKRFRGLQIIEIPSPALNILSVVQLIRQRIASSLNSIGRVVAIVIDPLGGIALEDDLQHHVTELKELCNTHRVFLFILVEDFLYRRHPAIEHFSQTVIHLEHDPAMTPYRRLHIQKARHQQFDSGFHQLELVRNEGFKIYPSIRAQSQRAHEKEKKPERHSKRLTTCFSTQIPISGNQTKGLNDSSLFIPGIPEGSVIFLMGPPGTFKQWFATGFALSKEDPPEEWIFGSNSLYLSFKADITHVNRAAQLLANVDFPSDNFLDKRNPMMTPEEVLFDVRDALVHNDKISRAVIWGLRRLSDMPMFAGGKAVQFLEALVTLLTQRSITSLLIDWPEMTHTNTLPIVDLSQYILLTRICKSAKALERPPYDGLWTRNGEKLAHVALLRIQRENQSFERNKGFVICQKSDTPAREVESLGPDFEDYWINAGLQWEQDPGLVEAPDGTILAAKETDESLDTE